MSAQQQPNPLQVPDVIGEPNGYNAGNPYLKGGIDTNDVLKAKLDPDFFEGYCIGTIHKRLHEATSRHRGDPQGRLRKYQSVLFYAQQLFDNFNRQQRNQHHNPEFDDLAQRFSRLPVQTQQSQQNQPNQPNQQNQQNQQQQGQGLNRILPTQVA